MHEPDVSDVPPHLLHELSGNRAPRLDGRDVTRSAEKLGWTSVRPGEGGGEARDDGEELFGANAGDAVELFGEDAADGGPLLFGSVLEHRDVMTREAEAELGGAQGVRKDTVGVTAERLFDGVDGPGLQ